MEGKVQSEILVMSELIIIKSCLGFWKEGWALIFYKILREIIARKLIIFPSCLCIYMYKILRRFLALKFDRCADEPERELWGE